MSLILSPEQPMCALGYGYEKLGNLLIEDSQNKYFQRKQMFAIRIIFAPSIFMFTIFLKDSFGSLSHYYGIFVASNSTFLFLSFFEK